MGSWMAFKVKSVRRNSHGNRMAVANHAATFDRQGILPASIRQKQATLDTCVRKYDVWTRDDPPPFSNRSTTLYTGDMEEKWLF